MKNQNFYTAVPRKDGGWSVKKSDSSRPASIHKTQSSAWKEARRLARGEGSEAVLRGRDGEIRSSNSYAFDSDHTKW